MRAASHLVRVAAGRMEVFWQHADARLDQLAGALLVAVAEGTVTDTHGAPWGLESDDFPATAPALHSAAVDVLFAVR